MRAASTIKAAATTTRPRKRMNWLADRGLTESATVITAPPGLRFPCQPLAFMARCRSMAPSYLTHLPVGARNTGSVHIILETPRLALRQFTEDDLDNLFGLNSDPEVTRYLTGGRPTPREEIRDQIIPFISPSTDVSTGSAPGRPIPPPPASSWAGSIFGPAPAATSPTSTWAIGCADPRGTSVTPPRDRAH